MKIGLLSDTHGYLDQSVFEYFKDCDEVWHGGDIGTLDVLEKLENFKPLRAVFGNIDGHEIRIRTKEIELISCGGMKIMIIHIAGKPPGYNKEVRKLIAEKRPEILVCGHSHILKIQHDKKWKVLFLNPGAAGKYGFHKVKTLLRFEIEGGRIFNMEVIEIGPRAGGTSLR
jgi:hypothetical protein